MTCTLYDRHGTTILDTSDPDDVRDHLEEHPGSIIGYEDSEGMKTDGIVSHLRSDEAVLLDGTRVPFRMIGSVEP